MNKVQNLIHELRFAIIESPVEKRYRDLSLLKMEELEAWLTWCGIKAKSGQIPEDGPEKVSVNAQRLTEDEWFKLLEKHKNNHRIIDRDADGNFVAEVREARGALKLYLAPDLRTMTRATYEAFCETMGSII